MRRSFEAASVVCPSSLLAVPAAAAASPLCSCSCDESDDVVDDDGLLLPLFDANKLLKVERAMEVG